MSEISDREIEDLSGEEFARRGNQLFEERVLPHIEDPEADARKFVAIDIATGDYEVSESELEVTRRLVKRRPEAKGRIWYRRVGSENAHHIGGRFQPLETSSS
ncbi:MAG: hypothetical protein BRD40_04290 [Bacteroidetes bacterium QS_1_65_9]|jgi:hypothetical protein|nr:MAG: hypothetical protein BRD40_04290 [Bacteroidetes bacterium QS_1_65_9]